MARQRAQRAQVRRPQLAASEREDFLLASAVIKLPSRFRRSHCAMGPLCPACEQPMKEYDRAFQCEPCRQIIIFFAVSDALPYIAARRVPPKKEVSQGAYSHKIAYDSSPPMRHRPAEPRVLTRFAPQWLKLNFSRRPEMDELYFCCCHAGSTHAKKSAAPNLSEVPQANAFHGRQNWRPEV
jgi:hypothetical protein